MKKLPVATMASLSYFEERIWVSRNASRTCCCRTHEGLYDSHVDSRAGGTSERRASGAGLEKALVTLRRIEESEERSLIEGPARGRAKPVGGRAIRPHGKQVRK
jgi:hypothetical protein